MKILFVATELPEASGITTFVENLASELRMAGHQIDVRDVTSFDFAAVSRQLPTYDVVHLHGLWKPALHRLARAIRSLKSHGSRAPRLVWSPHGMLQPWALKNKWWKKFAALALYQWWDLRRADLIHATAESEVRDVRRLGLRNRLVVAPLGVRVGGGEGVGGERRDRVLLFVSRVQRKKGLPNLLAAWSRVEKEEGRPGGAGQWRIRIVGPDEDGHLAELMSLCDRLGFTYSDKDGHIHCPPSASTSTCATAARPQVEFVGPKYGAELDAEYANADLFVLPTHSENFGSVVIEALAHKVPVITTKAAPWAELETHRCGWWGDDNVKALVRSLREAIGCPEEELREKGERGRALVEKKYTWRAVARQMEVGYTGIQGVGVDGRE